LAVPGWSSQQPAPNLGTPQRFSGNACRICGNPFALALPTHYCDELTYLRMAAEWDSRASGGAVPDAALFVLDGWLRPVPAGVVG